MMTSRERVLCALNHKEPDRVPIFFGASGVTTMNTSAYDRLKAYLGIKSETRTFWRALQYAILDEDVMVRFHSDARSLIPGPPPSTLARDLAPDRFIDAWGITWQLHPGNHYFDLTVPPLKDATIEDIAIDTQSVLPHGTPEDVRAEVRRRIKDWAPAPCSLPTRCSAPKTPARSSASLQG